MSERERIILGLGMVIGYCLCFVFEIWKITRSQEPSKRIERPEPQYQERKDPADWWKDIE